MVSNQILRKFGKNFGVGIVFIIFLSLIFAIAGALGITAIANFSDIGGAIASGNIAVILFAAFTLFAVGIAALVTFALSSKIGGIFGLKETQTHMPKKLKIVTVLILGLLIVTILFALESFLRGLDENFGGFTIQGLVGAFQAGNVIVFVANLIIIAIVGTIVIGAAAFFSKLGKKAESKGIPGT